MFYEDLRDVVLVGTSAGGMVISRAAETAAERIGRLVFVDALALLPGERIAERPAPMTTEVATSPPPRTPKRMFADLEPGLRVWALARYTLHPIAAMDARLS